MGSIRGTLRRLLAAGAALCLAAAASWGQSSKQDVVTFLNGDSLTGEIKSLERGVLRFKTEATETIDIKWFEVLTIRSPDVFQVWLPGGRRMVGNILPTENDRECEIVGPLGNETVSLDEVVQIRALKKTLISKFDVYVKFGLNYTAGTEVGRLTFEGDVRYKEANYILDLSAHSILTTQQSGTNRRAGLRFDWTQYLKGRNFVTAGVRAETNDELGIDLRSTISGGPGRRFLRSGTQLISGSLGLAASYEVATVSGSNTENIEAYVNLRHEIYINQRPISDLRTLATVYHSLNIDDRVRATLDSRLRQEFIKDLFLDFSLYVTYDSEPPDPDASTSDYGLITSIGYSF